jgi:hypothetical protein
MSSTMTGGVVWRTRSTVSLMQRQLSHSGGDARQSLHGENYDDANHADNKRIGLERVVQHDGHAVEVAAEVAEVRGECEDHRGDASDCCECEDADEDERGGHGECE